MADMPFNKQTIKNLLNGYVLYISIHLYICNLFLSYVIFYDKNSVAKISPLENRKWCRRINKAASGSVSEDGLLADLPLLMAAH